MKVKTYKIYLPDLDIAYKHDEIQEFQKNLEGNKTRLLIVRADSTNHEFSVNAPL